MPTTVQGCENNDDCSFEPLLILFGALSFLVLICFCCLVYFRYRRRRLSVEASNIAKDEDLFEVLAIPQLEEKLDDGSFDNINFVGSAIRVMEDPIEMEMLCAKYGYNWTPQLHHMNGKTYEITDYHVRDGRTIIGVFDEVAAGQGYLDGSIKMPLECVEIIDRAQHALEVETDGIDIPLEGDARQVTLNNYFTYDMACGIHELLQSSPDAPIIDDPVAYCFACSGCQIQRDPDPRISPTPQHSPRAGEEIDDSIFNDPAFDMAIQRWTSQFEQIARGANVSPDENENHLVESALELAIDRHYEHEDLGKAHSNQHGGVAGPQTPHIPETPHDIPETPNDSLLKRKRNTPRNRFQLRWPSHERI